MSCVAVIPARGGSRRIHTAMVKDHDDTVMVQTRNGSDFPAKLLEPRLGQLFGVANKLDRHGHTLGSMDTAPDLSHPSLAERFKCRKRTQSKLRHGSRGSQVRFCSPSF